MEPSYAELRQIGEEIEECIRRSVDAEDYGDPALACGLAARAIELTTRTLERWPETFAIASEERGRAIAILIGSEYTAFRA
jgi:hypothetical protein